MVTVYRLPEGGAAPKGPLSGGTRVPVKEETYTLRPGPQARISISASCANALEVVLQSTAMCVNFAVILLQPCCLGRQAVARLQCPHASMHWIYLVQHMPPLECDLASSRS